MTATIIVSAAALIGVYLLGLRAGSTGKRELRTRARSAVRYAALVDQRLIDERKHARTVIEELSTQILDLRLAREALEEDLAKASALRPKRQVRRASSQAAEGLLEAQERPLTEGEKLDNATRVLKGSLAKRKRKGEKAA